MVVIGIIKDFSVEARFSFEMTLPGSVKKGRIKTYLILVGFVRPLLDQIQLVISTE